MAKDLSRGWSERDVVAAVESAPDLQGAILRSMAENPGTKDPATGADSWLFVIERDGRVWRYWMPEGVREVASG